MELARKCVMVSKLSTTPKAKKTTMVIKIGEIIWTSIPERVRAKKYAVGEYMWFIISLLNTGTCIGI